MLYFDLPILPRLNGHGGSIWPSHLWGDWREQISPIALRSRCAGTGCGSGSKAVEDTRSLGELAGRAHKIEEGAMRNALAKNGAELIATDVQSSASRQITDIENLVTQEVDVVIINAHDAQAILPVCSIATGY